MLTDNELDDLYLPGRPDSHHAPDYIKAFARAVILAYEAKLRKQKPVAEVVSNHQAGMYDEFPIGTLLYAKQPTPVSSGSEPVAVVRREGSRSDGKQWHKGIFDESGECDIDDGAKLYLHPAPIPEGFKKIADLAFDTLNKPASGYYEGLKLIMDTALAAARSE